jgi:hypothetical protein
MSNSSKPEKDFSWLGIEPDPPPWDVPLDETFAHFHFQGDLEGKYDDVEGARRLWEELHDPSWSARLKRFFGLR